MLAKLEPNHVNELYLTNKESAIGKYKEIYKDAIEQGPGWTKAIKTLANSLSTNLLHMLITISVNLFQKARARATIKSRQSELLEFIAKERDSAATDDLAEALDNSHTIQEGNLNDVVSKLTRKHLLLQSKAAKKLQKNLWARTKANPPCPQKMVNIFQTTQRSNVAIYRH